MINSSLSKQSFWAKWLVVTYAVFILFGLSMVIFPNLTAQLFSFILFSNSKEIVKWNDEIVAYVQLIHAILGAVIAALASLMLMLASGWISGTEVSKWRMLFIALMVWLIPDTTYSLLNGFWQNAVFNMGFAVPVLVGLMRIR